MIYSNVWLIDFIGNNWLALAILYGVLTAIFPDSRVLSAIGESFSERFPVFKKKGE
jgi:hypothetical protein